MADVVKSLEVNVEVEGLNTVEELENELKQIDAELKKVKNTSEEWIQGAARWRAIKDKLDEVKNSANGTGESFEKIKGSSGIFTSGIEQISESMTSLANGTGSYSTNLSNLRQGLLSAAKGAKGFQLTLKGVRGALIATGIGALVVALGLIVAYWDDIKGLVSGVTSEQKKLIKEKKKAVALAEKELGLTLSTENSLRLQGKTEAQITKEKIKQIDAVIEARKADLEAAIQIRKSQLEAEKRNKRILSGILKTISIPISFILKNIDLISQGLVKIGALDKATTLLDNFTDTLAGSIFDPEEMTAKGKAANEAAELEIKKLENTRDGYLLQLKKAGKKSAKEIEEEEAKAAQEKADALERIRQGLIDTEAEERAEKLRLIKQDYWEQIELAKKFYGEESQVVLDLEEARRNALKAQQKVFDDEDAEAYNQKQESIKEIQESYRQKEEDDKAVTEEEKLNLEKERIIAELDLLKATKEQKAEIEAYYDKQIGDAKIASAKELGEKEKAQAKEIADAKREINNLLFNDAINLAETFFAKEGKMSKDAFNAVKAMKVAQAIIATYQGANAIFASAAANPKTVLFPAQPFLLAGSAIANGLINVKKILSTKIGSSVGGDNGGGGGGSNPVIQGGSVRRTQPRNINLTQPRTQNIKVDPLKVFVLESDITGAQLQANNTKQVSVIK